MQETTRKNENDLYSNDEIGLKELLSVLWLNKKKILYSTLFFAIFSIVIALSLTEIYKSETILSITISHTISNILLRWALLPWC